MDKCIINDIIIRGNNIHKDEFGKYCVCGNKFNRFTDAQQWCLDNPFRKDRTTIGDDWISKFLERWFKL